MEFPTAGPVLYLISFIFLAMPLLTFYSDYRARRKQQAAGGKVAIPPPTKITELRVYPIKSCRGFKVDKTKLLKTGLDLDRQWMFVDAVSMDFLTIRQISKMTLIDTVLTENDELEVSIRNSQPKVRFAIPAHPSKQWLDKNSELSEVEIWGRKVDGHVYSKELTAPFSSFFEREVRLVYKGPTPRVLVGNGAPEVLGRTESIKFADLAPLQISNQKSIDELNGRLSQIDHEPISIERFRPNIVVEGETPWYEDTWKMVKIGEQGKSIMVDVVARCARCQVPNVDPDTAVKDKKQPYVEMVLKQM
jgi:uncharacterized protein YcbX